MSSRYESLSQANLYPDVFGVSAPLSVPTPASVAGGDVWPRRPGVFVRRATEAQGGDGATTDATDATEAADTTDAIDASDTSDGPGASDAPNASRAPTRLVLGHGQFGLVPRWVKSASDAKLRSTKLVNARSEARTTANTTRDAWLAGQRCIVPVMAFFDEDWRTGKAVLTRIARVDGKPMGLAGLWERWEKDGEVIDSFTVLTVNANSHALMHRYQHPGVEKRMPAVLNEGAYSAWLSARADKAQEFLRAYPANWLLANPVEKKGKKPQL